MNCILHFQGEKVYSYTIITMESNKTLSWLHDRMPAILETENQVLVIIFFTYENTLIYDSLYFRDG